MIVAFYMQDCPACHEYIPRFQKVAARHPKVQAQVLEAEANSATADRFQIDSVPQTLALRKPQGMIRIQGPIPDDQIEWLFQVAEKENR